MCVGGGDRDDRCATKSSQFSNNETQGRNKRGSNMGTRRANQDTPASRGVPLSPLEVRGVLRFQGLVCLLPASGWLLGSGGRGKAPAPRGLK